VGEGLDSGPNIRTWGAVDGLKDCLKLSSLSHYGVSSLSTAFHNGRTISLR